jgi:hypothetical protein
VDRAAQIESASRSLRQQMARAGTGGVSGRPRSKGSLHSGNRGQSLTGFNNRASQGSSANGQRGENAQRRIRSAENQHRQVSAVPRDGPYLNQAVWPSNSATPQFASETVSGATLGTADPAIVENELEVSLEAFVQQGGAQAAGADADETSPVMEFPEELKRPASRKKDPSASAAVGLGNFNGPARLSDAFSESQRKTRQPIPVESWGPRPPSRAGVPQKSVPLDTGLDAHVDPKIVLSRTRDSVSSKVGKVQGDQAFSKGLGDTWARARQDPAGSEVRRGRERKAPGRAPGEAHDHLDLGVFGSGRPVGKQSISKIHGGALEPSQFRGPNVAVRQAATPHSEAWVSAGMGDAVLGMGALEVSGYHIGDSGPAASATSHGQWPSSPSQCGSPPSRGAPFRFSSATTEPESVEDAEVPVDPDIGQPPHRAGPQVIVNRSLSGQEARGDVRRGAHDGRGGGRPMPFSTALGADFLSLFAS